MLRFVLGLVLGAFAIQAQADELDLKIAFDERYIACFKDHIRDDTLRLACYDDLFTTLTAWLADDTQVPTGCKVEDFSHHSIKVAIQFSGVMTCESGKLTYRIYDAGTGDFIQAGNTTFDGFVFLFNSRILDMPNDVEIRYSVETPDT